MALLGKWLWRIGDDSQGLWNQVISSKSDISREGWLVHYPLPPFSALRKGILAAKELFRRQVRFRVGKGDKIRFWTDLWVGDPLSSAFPELLNCARNQKDKVLDYMERRGDGNVWGLFSEGI